MIIGLPTCAHKEMLLEIINLAIITIRYIALITNNNNSINTCFLDKKCEDIMQIILGLDSLYTSLSKQKHTLMEEIRKIHESLNNIHTSYIENEVIMKNIICNAQKTINIKVGHINRLSNNIFNIEDLTSDIDKNRDVIDKILTELSFKNYIIHKVNTGEFKVLKNDNTISEISVGKTRCKLVVNNSACQFSIGKSDISCIDTYIQLLDNL